MLTFVFIIIGSENLTYLVHRMQEIKICNECIFVKSERDQNFGRKFIEISDTLQHSREP